MENNYVQSKPTLKSRMPAVVKGVFLVFVAFVILGLVALVYFRSQKTDAPVEESREVATDVNFEEAVGELLEGVPDLPTYPGALLKGSATNTLPEESIEGYRIVWMTSDTVKAVMDWYGPILEEDGWTVEYPDDPNAQGEQVMQVYNGSWKGYIAAEVEEDGVEIVADFKENEK